MKVKEFAEIKNGFAFKSEKYVDSGIRVIRINNVQKGYIIDEMPAFYPLSEKNNLKDYMLEKEDILMSLTGNVGRVGILNEKFLPAALNQRVACIRTDNKKVLKKYIYYAFLSKKFEQDCIKSSQGIAQKNMSTEWLKEYDINIAKIDKQYKIVEIFDKLSSCINLYESQLKNLDILIKSRFVEMFGDVIANNKKWKKIKLSELCDISRGGSPRPINEYLGGTIPWIKIGDATNGDNIYINSTKEHIIEKGIKKSRLIKKGSLIFANCGVSLGFCRIINFDGCIHDGWLAFQNIDKRLNKIFLLATINQLTEYFRSIAPGGTQPNLNTDIMGNYEQILPPLELQEEYIKFIDCVDKSKFVVQQALEKTKMLMDSLMQEYFG